MKSLKIVLIVLLLAPALLASILPTAVKAQSVTLNVTLTPVPGHPDLYIAEGSASAGGVGASLESRLIVEYEFIRPGQAFAVLPDNMNRNCSGGLALGDQCLAPAANRAPLVDKRLSGGQGSVSFREEIYLGSFIKLSGEALPPATQVRFMAKLCIETPDDPKSYRKFYHQIYGPIQLPLGAQEESVDKKGCPACTESGLDFKSGYQDSFPDAKPPFDETICSYNKLDTQGNTVGEGTIKITTYTDVDTTAYSFFQDVETSRDRVDHYQNSQEVIPKLLDDVPFDDYIYQLENLLPDGSRSYEMVGMHLLGKHEIRVTVKYNGSQNDAKNAYDALEKCAFSNLPECQGNHPPKLEITYLGYTPGSKGTLGTIEFEAKATDEDGDKLRLRWFFPTGGQGLMELKESSFDMITKSVQKDGVTTVHLIMNTPPLSGSTIFAYVYDDRGGRASTYCSYELPENAQGISNLDLPDQPWLEVVMGKTTVNGREVLPGDIFVLNDGDIVETVTSDPNTNQDGGYAIINYPGTGTVKIGPNARLGFYGWKNLQLLRGRIRIEGRQYPIKKESGRVTMGDEEMNINVAGPETLEQWIESVQDPTEREAWKERLKEIDAGNGRSKWAGTQFEVIAEENGTTSYYVFEGVVDVSDIAVGKTVAVGAGETTVVKPNGTPSDPIPFDAGSMEWWWEPLRENLAQGSPEDTGLADLTFESRSRPTGSDVQIPLMLESVAETVGNMDLTLAYDPMVLEAREVLKGSLTADSLFDYTISGGTIRVALADREGFSGDGSVAYVRFKVIGDTGTSSELGISEATANESDYSVMALATHNGLFLVTGIDELRGDCDGDGKLSPVDALCALQMAVGKITENLAMDVTGDGKVTSLDARQILKMAVGITETPAGASISTTNIEQFKALGRKCQPVEMTLKVGENGEMEILYRVQGEADSSCSLYEKVVKDASGLGLEGKDMTCKVPMNVVTGASPLASNFDIKDCCSGSLADAIDKLGQLVKGE